MAVSKFLTRDWLLGWLIPQGKGGAYTQAVTQVDSTGAEYNAANPLPVALQASSVSAAFNPTGEAALAVTNASARVVMGSAGPTALVINTGANTAYVKFGNSSVVSDTTSGYPVPSGWGIAFDIGTSNFIAAITSSSTTNLTITTGTGIPALVGGDASTGGTVVSGNVGVLGVDAATIASAANPLPTSGIGFAYSNAFTITRPANQTPYTAGDVVGGALTFTSMGSSAGRIMITTDQLELDLTAIPAGMTSFTLYLYNVTPPSALADNAPWDLPSGDRASYLGFVTMGSPVDLGSTCYVETNIINKQLKLAGTSLFGYLVTTAGYTPAANSEVYVATLHAVGLGL